MASPADTKTRPSSVTGRVVALSSLFHSNVPSFQAVTTAGSTTNRRDGPMTSEIVSATGKLFDQVAATGHTAGMGSSSEAAGHAATDSANVSIRATRVWLTRL